MLSSQAQAQSPKWKWQNPIPSGYGINSFHFQDKHHGWIVGNWGYVGKTADGGNTWEDLSLAPLQSGLKYVYFTDTLHGWIVEEFGKLFRTTNGGRKWENITPQESLNLSSYQFTDSITAWAVDNQYSLMKSTDGGYNWEIFNHGYSGPVYSVKFVTKQFVWMRADSGKVLKSNNGGQTWELISHPAIRGIRTINFVDGLHGWGTTYKNYQYFHLHTNDSGLSWDTAMVSPVFPAIYFHLSTFVAVDSLTALDCYGDTLRKTTNGGQTWQQYQTGNFGLPSKIQFFDNYTGLGARREYTGIPDYLKKTTDGGITWKEITYGTRRNLNSVHFFDELNGLAVGDSGCILRTENGGKLWNQQQSGTNSKLWSVCLLTQTKGLATAQNGEILRTSNGGTNWLVQSSTNPIQSINNSLFFLDSLVGWMSAPFRKTTDGGMTWTSPNLQNLDGFQTIYFVSPQIGWAGNTNGSIYYTTNGGAGWQPQISGTTQNINSVYFTDEFHGWAVGDNGIILKTTNGGNTWQKRIFGTLPTFYDVHFTDELNGWISGSEGLILRTQNGGITWVGQYGNNSNSLKSVFFKGNKGWIAGSQGTLISTTIEPPLLSHSSSVSGSVYYHSGPSCDSDTSSNGLGGVIISAHPGPYYGISDASGRYKLKLPVDSQSVTYYSIAPISINTNSLSAQPVCPAEGDYVVALDSITDSLSGKDFRCLVSPCHFLEIRIASSRRRRCRRGNNQIYFKNKGSIPAPDASILVQFPKHVIPITASIPHIVVNDSVWRFNVGAVDPGEVNSFQIIDSVSCGLHASWNSLFCNKATIYPAPDCPPPTNWNGANIAINGSCNQGNVILGIYNTGTSGMSDSTDYWVYLDSIQVKAGKVKLAVGDSLKLQVISNGMNVQLTVNQVLGHPTELFVSAAFGNCNPTTSFETLPLINHFPKSRNPSKAQTCLPLSNSYDPNDKSVVPLGFTNQHVVPSGTGLDYTIRFQNTGNDTAFTVVIVDSLDQNLNPETFDMGPASHSYSLSMQTTRTGKTFLKWTFNRILLPDSNVNELRSHGFLQFRISPKDGIALGSQVRNESEIYFDYNPAVITNQTLTTFDNLVFTDPSLNGNVQVITATTRSLSPNQIGVSLYPNPVTDHQLTVSFREKGSLVLYNVQGRKVLERFKMEGTQTLPITLSPGLYLAHLKTEKGLSVVKVVLE